MDLIRLLDKASGSSAAILPAAGGLLQGFTVATQNGPLNIIDHYSDSNELKNELSLSYKSAKLSPFVCRMANGKYEWGGKLYEITQKFSDGAAIHGLLYNKPFKLVDHYANENQASVRLKYQYKADDAGYPFMFTCELHYTLHPNRVLQLETNILNLGDEVIPYADGWHPYFTLGEPIDSCEMQFNSAAMLEFDNQLLPTGKILPMPDFLEMKPIGSRMLDNCFELQQNGNQAACILQNSSRKIRLGIYTNQHYPYLQVYTPPHRNSIAIENLSGAPDCFNNGMGLIALQPRQSKTFNAWYQVELA